MPDFVLNPPGMVGGWIKSVNIANYDSQNKELAMLFFTTSWYEQLYFREDSVAE